MNDTIKDLMARAVGEGVFPGGVLLYGAADRMLFQEAFGVARLDTREPVTTDTAFDLASLTKPLAVAVACMVLARRAPGFLSRNLGDILPVFRGSDKEGITVAQLLSHTAGFTDWRPYYKDLAGLPFPARAQRLLELLRDEPLSYPPGKGAIYSDLGYMALDRVVESVAHARLDRFVSERVYAPLEIRDLFFLPLDGPGQAGRPPEGRALAATEDCPWRGKLLYGEVHDDNAWALGGVAGHAGLFGTAQGVWRLVAELVGVYNGKGPSKVFERGIVREFLCRKGSPGSFVLGFDTPTRPLSSSGARFSDASIGHLGFTGTSFWADLEKEVIVVLLTNRVHPHRGNEGIKAFRPRIHDAVMAALGA